VTHDGYTTGNQFATIQSIQKKLQWTASNINNVHWEVFTSTLSSYHHEDQCRLVLFVNNKLPLQASPTHPHHGSSLCPSCQCKLEDNWHFLECMHSAHVALFQALHYKLMHLTQQLKLHPCILTTFWLGLVEICNAMPRYSSGCIATGSSTSPPAVTSQLGPGLPWANKK